MAYLAPTEFVTKMVDTGESKLLMSTRDTPDPGLTWLAPSWRWPPHLPYPSPSNTGNPLLGAVCSRWALCMLYLLGFDLLTGVFTLAPWRSWTKRPGATWHGVVRNWNLVFIGNFAGAFTVAMFAAIIFTSGFTEAPNAIGQRIGTIGEGRTLGYAAHGIAGMLTLFIRAVMCSWMVSTGVVAAMMSTTVSGKVIAMWMPIMVFFYMGFEHSVVNMYLFPSGLLLWQVHLHGLPDLERNSHRAGQPGRRSDLCRRHALHHPLQDLAPARAARAFGTATVALPRTARSS